MMKQSYLKELAEEIIAMESAHADGQMDITALLESSIDATMESITSLEGLMVALEANFNHTFEGVSEVSVESYKNYEHTTGLILKAHGLDIPTSVICPSFEADGPEATKKEAKERTDNVIVRAGKRLWEMLQQLGRWILSFFKKKGEDTVKESEKLVEEAKRLESELKNGEGESKPSTESSEVKTYTHWSHETFNDLIALFASLKDLIKDSDEQMKVFRTVTESNVGEVRKQLEDLNRKYEETVGNLVKKLTSGSSGSEQEYTFDRLKAVRHVNEIKLVADTSAKIMREAGSWVQRNMSTLNSADEKRVELLAGAEVAKHLKMIIGEVPRKCEAMARLVNVHGHRAIKRIRAAA